MKKDRRVSRSAVADLVEQIGRAAYGASFASGLNPAQWQALRFLSRANRFSQTVGAFAEFQGTTQGTASQTIKALLDKKYLVREQNSRDRRSFRLHLTPRGQKMIQEDPLQELSKAVAALEPDQLSYFAICLDTVLNEMLRQRGQQRFGICNQCGHLCLTARKDHLDGPHECALMGEPLTNLEIKQVCRRFSAATSVPPA